MEGKAMSYLEVYECDFCGGRVERKISWSYLDREGIPSGWTNVHGKWLCKKCVIEKLGITDFKDTSKGKIIIDDPTDEIGVPI